MKTMTCRDMGGSCDFMMTADTAEEMMKKGGDHVMATKDPAHMKIAEGIETMSDEDMAKWNKMFMKKWNKTKEALH